MVSGAPCRDKLRTSVGQLEVMFKSLNGCESRQQLGSIFAVDDPSGYISDLFRMINLP